MCVYARHAAAWGRTRPSFCGCGARVQRLCAQRESRRGRAGTVLARACGCWLACCWSPCTSTISFLCLFVLRCSGASRLSCGEWHSAPARTVCASESCVQWQHCLSFAARCTNVINNLPRLLCGCPLPGVEVPICTTPACAQARKKRSHKRLGTTSSRCGFLRRRSHQRRPPPRLHIAAALPPATATHRHPRQRRRHSPPIVFPALCVGRRRRAHPVRVLLHTVVPQATPGGADTWMTPRPLWIVSRPVSAHRTLLLARVT